MYLRNNFFWVSEVLAIISVLLSTIFFPYTALAKTDNQHLTCPIVGEINSSFSQKSDQVVKVEDTFFETISVTNDTNYTMAGVRVAVVAYFDGTEVPAFWTMLPEVHQLQPKMSKVLPVEINLKTLPAGQYVFKVFATQGDEVAMLGKIINDNFNLKGLSVIKSDSQTDNLSISTAVNGTKYTGQTIVIPKYSDINAAIETINSNELPLLNSSLVAVITQGKVPLGAAVRVEKKELVTLVPQAKRLTKLTDLHVEGGEYTVYVALTNEGLLQFQPISSVPVKVADTEGESSWAYVSKVGLSDYPLKIDSEVVACVNYVGQEKNSDLFLEPLELNFTLKFGSEVKTFLAKSSEMATANYFHYTPQQLNLKNFSLQTDFLQERFRGLAISADTPNETEEEGDVLTNISLTEVDRLQQSFICVDAEVCSGTNITPVLSGDTTTSHNNKPLWFFGSILVTASLLMYLLLGRLEAEVDHGKKDHSVELK